MKKQILTVMAAALLLAGGQAYGGQARAVGTTVLVQGDVKLRRPGATEFPALKAGDYLYLGDVIESGPGAGASIALLYGTEIRLNENTILEFVTGKKNSDTVKLAMGQVWTRLLHKRGGVEIRTRTAICAVRGTEADIEQLEALTVKVYEGRVDVRNEAGKVSLRAGEMTRVAGPAAPPAKAAKMEPADLGRWHEGLSSADIREFLEKLRASQGEHKKLEFNVGAPGKADKDVRIKLKKKDGEE